MVKDIFSDSEGFVTIKLFPGLKVTSRHIPPEQSRSNINITNTDFILKLNASFSKHFRNKIRNKNRN